MGHFVLWLVRPRNNTTMPQQSMEGGFNTAPTTSRGGPTMTPESMVGDTTMMLLKTWWAAL